MDEGNWSACRLGPRGQGCPSRPPLCPPDDAPLPPPSPGRDDVPDPGTDQAGPAAPEGVPDAAERLQPHPVRPGVDQRLLPRNVAVRENFRESMTRSASPIVG